MSTIPPWVNDALRSRQPVLVAPAAPGLTIPPWVLKSLALLFTTLLGAGGVAGWHRYTAGPATAPSPGQPPVQPAPNSGGGGLRPCGKCGSPDCGCQQDRATKAEEKAARLEDSVGQLLEQIKRMEKPKAVDPFEAGNTGTTSVPDETGKLWANADSNDPNQRSWYSTDAGRTWYRDVAAPTVRVSPTTCRCPATGNRDGSRGPNNCLCHDLALDCKCHRGAGIVYTRLPAAAPSTPAPVRVMPMTRPQMAVRSAAACAT